MAKLKRIRATEYESAVLKLYSVGFKRPSLALAAKAECQKAHQCDTATFAQHFADKHGLSVIDKSRTTENISSKTPVIVGLTDFEKDMLESLAVDKSSRIKAGTY